LAIFENMNCLKEYIGIHGCKTAQPESGLLLMICPASHCNLLTGSQTATSKTYVRVWEDVQTRALRRMSVDIAAAFGKRYRVKTITDMVQLPIW
jgi:hypothetical protein